MSHLLRRAFGNVPVDSKSTDASVLVEGGGRVSVRMTMTECSSLYEPEELHCAPYAASPTNPSPRRGTCVFSPDKRRYVTVISTDPLQRVPWRWMASIVPLIRCRLFLSLEYIYRSLPRSECLRPRSIRYRVHGLVIIERQTDPKRSVRFLVLNTRPPNFRSVV